MALRSTTAAAIGIALALVSASTAATADSVRPEDRIKERKEDAPRELEGVGLTEKLGDYVPMDLELRDEQGRTVKLGDYFGNGRPVILTLNYSDCPMLCDVMLGGLVKGMLEIPHTKGVANLTAGRQFEIVTVSLNPRETAERARSTKQGYLERFDDDVRADVERGWHFLTGDEASIRALADAVGFGYRYLPRENDYLHPSSIMVLSHDGMVVRYLNGVEYGAADLVDSLFAAGNKDPQASIGFLYSCFHYDSKANDYSDFGRHAMAYGGGAFAFLLIAMVATWHITRSRRSRAGA